MPRPIRPAALQHCKTRGSALIATLCVVGLISFSVAAMLYNVRQLSRATDDKMAWEENYHVAIAGIQMTKAWLIKSALAKAELPSTDADKFEAVTSGSINLCKYVKTNRDNTTLLNNMSATDIIGYFDDYPSKLTPASTDVYGDRKLIWEYKGPGNNDRAIVFQRDYGDGKPQDSIFGATDHVRSAVTSIRVTTPFRSNGTTAKGEKYQKDDLRQVSLIIEATGVTYSNGVPKSRTIRQKLLVVPGVDVSSGSNAPPLTPGSAIVAGQSLTVGGSSHMDVNWGPVQVKGNADLLDINAMTFHNGDANNAKRLSVSVAQQPDKFHGSGFNTPNDSPDVGVDKWMRWQTSGLLYAKNGNNRNEIIPWYNNTTGAFSAPTGNLPSGSYRISDIFTQLMGVPSTSPSGGIYTGNINQGGWDISKVQLPDNYTSTGISALSGKDVFFGAPTNGLYPLGQGAFVQQSTAVATAVDTFMNNDMNYTTWKQFAISKNLYAKPNRTNNPTHYVNSSGVTLYVKASDRSLIAIPTGQTVPAGYSRFENLEQVSMKSLVPGDGVTIDIPDRILFIDTAQGTATGTPTNITLGSNDAFFWKGLFYLNGNLTLGGSGNAPTINMKNPDQYAQFLSNTTQYRTNGYMVGNCICDGILYASGTVDRTGNSSVYGTVAAKGGMASGGGPDIYYNSRNKMGLFQEQIITPNNELAGLISGPICEIDS